MRSTLQKIKSKAGTIYTTGRHWSWGAGVALFWCASAQAVTPPIVAITAPATSVTRTTDFTYNANGSLKAEIREPDNAQFKLETGYQYDAWGNRTETTVSSPATGSAAIVTTKSSETYDARGQFPLTQKNALGHASTTTYDARYGAVSRIDDVNQLAMQIEYDGFGRKILEISPDGTRRKWAYSLCDTSCEVGASYFIKVSSYASDGVTQSAPLQKTYFDVLDREVKTETYGFDSTLMIYTKKEYDSRGNLARSSRSYFVNFTPQWTSYAYDELNRLVSSTAPDDAVTSHAYDGLRSTTTNALNQTTTKIVNANGQLAQVTDNLNQAISYQYDAFGNLWLTMDPKNNMNVMAYDALGRKIKMYEPDTGGTLYDYDVLGRLVRQTDARGNVTDHAYDVLNRLRVRTEADMVSRWDFDDCAKGIARLCRVSTDNGYQSVPGYDAYGRMSSNTTSIDAIYSSSSTFDSSGRIATMTYPTGLTLEYEYQGHIFLKEIRNKATGALYWRAKKMDAEGRMREQLYGNQIVSNAVYNEANGAIKEQYAGAGKGVQNLVYDFDKIGNLQSRSDSNQNLTESFLYDGLNRLTTATVNSGSAGLVTQSYGYDGIGNIKQRLGVGTYSYLETSNKPHAVSVITLEAGGKRYYTYDVAGNLLTELQTSAVGATIAAKGRTVSYTSFNMPLTIATPSASMTFVYGPQHQRIKEIAPGLTTVYLNGSGSGSLLYEKDIKGNGEVEHRQFISANGVVIAVVKTVNGQNTTQYFHRDYLGSVVAVSDEAGTVIERFAYEASGKRRFAAGGQDTQDALAGVNTKRGFTNHAHLDTLGLVHMNGRVYDPLVARFMSADPGVPHPEDLQSYNRYSYARNNPLAYVDLDGFNDKDHRNNDTVDDRSNFWSRFFGSIGEFLTGGGSGSGSVSNQFTSNTNGSEVSTVGAEGMMQVFVSANKLIPDINANSEANLVKVRDYFSELLEAQKAATRNQSWSDMAWQALEGLPGGGGVASGTSKLGRLAYLAEKATEACCCFPAGTPVVTQNGATPIEQIQVGQLVLARDEKSGLTELKPVTQLFITRGKAIFRLTTRSESGVLASLEVTDNHPFWVEGIGWVESAKLKSGMVLKDVNNASLSVADLKSLGRTETTYNFTVADFHTYFAGPQKAFVHNACACTLAIPKIVKAVNSNLPHAVERAVERGIYKDSKSATDGLKLMTEKLSKEGFPVNAIPDTANADRVLVPIGDGGMAVYQVAKNGTAKLKTVLNEKITP